MKPKDEGLEKIVDKLLDEFMLGRDKKTRRLIRNRMKEARDYGIRSICLIIPEDCKAEINGRHINVYKPLVFEKPSLWQRLTAFFRKEGKLPRNFKLRR